MLGEIGLFALQERLELCKLLAPTEQLHLRRRPLGHLQHRFLILLVQLNPLLDRRTLRDKRVAHRFL